MYFSSVAMGNDTTHTNTWIQTTLNKKIICSSFMFLIYHIGWANSIFIHVLGRDQNKGQVMDRNPAGGWWGGAAWNKGAPIKLFRSHYRKKTNPNFGKMKINQPNDSFCPFKPLFSFVRKQQTVQFNLTDLSSLSIDVSEQHLISCTLYIQNHLNLTTEHEPSFIHSKTLSPWS